MLRDLFDDFGDCFFHVVVPVALIVASSFVAGAIINERLAKITIQEKTSISPMTALSNGKHEDVIFWNLLKDNTKATPFDIDLDGTVDIYYYDGRAFIIIKREDS